MNEPAGHKRNLKARFSTAATLCALALASGLALHGLGNHLFWEDEAALALFARNQATFGEPTAWDAAKRAKNCADISKSTRKAWLSPPSTASRRMAA